MLKPPKTCENISSYWWDLLFRGTKIYLFVKLNEGLESSLFGFCIFMQPFADLVSDSFFVYILAQVPVSD